MFFRPEDDQSWRSSLDKRSSFPQSRWALFNLWQKGQETPERVYLLTTTNKIPVLQIVCLLFSLFCEFQNYIFKVYLMWYVSLCSSATLNGRHLYCTLHVFFFFWVDKIQKELHFSLYPFTRHMTGISFLSLTEARLHHLCPLDTLTFWIHFNWSIWL